MLTDFWGILSFGERVPQPPPKELGFALREAKTEVFRKGCGGNLFPKRFPPRATHHYLTHRHERPDGLEAFRADAADLREVFDALKRLAIPVLDNAAGQAFADAGQRGQFLGGGVVNVN